jgi:hypothetical protein
MSESGSEHSKSVELVDVYGREDGSEIDEEENLHTSMKYPESKRTCSRYPRIHVI